MLSKGDDRAAKWSNAVKFDAQTPEFKRLGTERAELLQGLFDIADQNDNGSLDIEELRLIMPNAEIFMSVVDTGHDSQISMQEFKDWSDAEFMDHISPPRVARLNKLIRLARCGKQIRNGGEKLPPVGVFKALDMNGDSALSIEEIDNVLGGDSHEFTSAWRNLAQNGVIHEKDFNSWADANSEDFKKLKSMLLDINVQVVHSCAD